MSMGQTQRLAVALPGLNEALPCFQMVLSAIALLCFIEAVVEAVSPMELPNALNWLARTGLHHFP